ncbi:GTPase [Dactylosporangium sp. NPDC005555]|uniref:GTPase family protein n=1 Tax=Dactylosporangium sp. NPDC005555 TaxID=3154889 RepID=UPI0033B22ADC
MRVAFLGKCGSGKTSLVNALFGLDFKTGGYAATTLDLQREIVRIPGMPEPVEVVDTPGFAESVETEQQYRALYQSLLPTVDHIVWVTSCHPRVFRPDQEALVDLADAIGATGMTVVLTKADTIGPNDWDEAAGRPSPGQLVSLREQAGNVFAKFAPYSTALGIESIVWCATPTGWGLDVITEHIRAALTAAPAKG